MVAHEVPVYGGNDEYTGTMVVNDHSGAANSGQKEPSSFMKYFNKGGADNGAPATSGSSAASGADAGPALDSQSSDFTRYFSTGKQLEVSESSSIVDLQQALISLNEAYLQEQAALEKYYASRREHLQHLIDLKRNA